MVWRYYFSCFQRFYKHMIMSSKVVSFHRIVIRFPSVFELLSRQFRKINALWLVCKVQVIAEHVRWLKGCKLRKTKRTHPWFEWITLFLRLIRSCYSWLRMLSPPFQSRIHSCMTSPLILIWKKNMTWVDVHSNRNKLRVVNTAFRTRSKASRQNME